MPKVSVIIPVYNVEKYLRQCLDSVINQTLTDLEIICVNDGSTDGSLKILEEYAQKDKRVKVINKQNGGLSSARNAGLEAVTAEYVYFLDSDDWIELETIEKLYTIMTTNNVDAVVHGVKNILADKKFTGTLLDAQAWFDSYDKAKGVYDVPKEIDRCICAVAWNKLYKMEIINQYNCRFPEGLINEDEAFIWTYMIHCDNYYYLNDRLYNYLRRSNSIMATRDNTEKALDIFEILKQIYITVDKYKNIEDYKEYLTQNYIGTASLFYNSKIPKKCRKKALEKIEEYYGKINHDTRIMKLYRKLKYKHLIQALQGIFSVKNTDTHKVVKILGLKFKFRKYKKY